MGLDMYLTKKYYVKNWKHYKKSERWSITVSKGGKKYKGIDTKLIRGISTDAIYWRKANAIHKWFVDHCQGGVDDCREAYVSRDQLRELLAAVSDVLGMSELVEGMIVNGQTIDKNGNWVDIMEKGKYIKDPTTAKQLLPTESGCFFGGTNYDQYYYNDLVFTKKELERILKQEEDGGEFYYQSSW